MKTDWTETLRDKLSESQIAPPESLWAKISSDLDTVSPVSIPKRSHRRWWWAAAACLALLLIGTSYFIFSNQDISNQYIPLVAEADDDIKLDDNDTPKDLKADEDVTPLIAQSNQSTIHLVKEYSDSQDSAFAHNASENKESQVGEAVSSDEFAQPVSNDSVFTQPTEYRNEYIADINDINQIEKLAQNHKSLAMNLYASNSLSQSFSTNSTSNGWLSDYYNPSIDDTPDSSDPSQSRSADPDAPSMIDASHKIPIRVGASVRYSLTDSWSISAGITYTRLSSTISWEKKNAARFETDQTLHYIGIPVSVDYSFQSFGNFTFYLTAGTMAEKCVYGRSKYCGQFSNLPAITLSESQLQFSTFTGLGLQYALSQHLSLFAEPLATYYFDNGSSLINIYHDRPFTLDLRLGLSITLR